MRCGKCQREMTPGDTICRFCGWEAEDIPVTPEYTQTCPSCHSIIKEGIQFCPVCGMQLVTPVVTMPPLRETIVKPKTNITVIILSIALALSLALGGFALYMSLSNQNDNTQQEESREDDDTKETKDDEKEEKEESNDQTAESQPSAESQPETPPVEQPGSSTPPPALPSNSSASSTSDGYLFPSNTRYVTYEYLSGLSRSTVALIRNEIYARHGYIFKTEPYKSYFAAKSWYIPNPNFSISDFNSVEKANSEYITRYEEMQGWR